MWFFCLKNTKHGFLYKNIYISVCYFPYAGAILHTVGRELFVKCKDQFDMISTKKKKTYFRKKNHFLLFMSSLSPFLFIYCSAKET